MGMRHSKETTTPNSDASTEDLNSRLSLAVKYDDNLGVKSALDAGANPNTCIPWTFSKASREKQGNSVPVLTIASYKGHLDVVTTLLEAKADTENRGDFRLPALGIATAHGHITIVEKLLDHGADIDSKNSKTGSLPIHLAAANGNIKMVKLLQIRGASLDVLSKSGSTPLHEAAYKGSKHLVEWLVQQGVDVSATNNNGETAAYHAEYRGYKDLALWLRSSTRTPVTTVTPLRTSEPIVFTQNILHKKVYIMNFINFPERIRNKYGETTEEIVLENRKGASMDSKNLHSTLKNLGYEIIIKEDMTSIETNTFLDEIQQDQSLKFLLLFVLSHGVDDETFYTSDGYQYPMEQLKERFTDSNCRQLKGRSKIILSNFCRGKNTERISTDGDIPKYETPHNMVSIYASHGGFKAQRSHERGTIFVHNFCEVLNERPNATIVDVFNEIYVKMTNDEGQTPEMKVSAPFDNFTF